MVFFSSWCELDLGSWGPNGRLCCHGLWPLSSPAISGGIRRISFYFCREFIKVGEGCLPPSLAALGWLLFSLSTQGSARPSLHWNQGQDHSAVSVLVLCPRTVFLAIFPLSSWRGGEKSRSKEMRRLWNRVCIPSLSPKSSKAFSCILCTSFLCQISLDENRTWQEGRKKEIT